MYNPCQAITHRFVRLSPDSFSSHLALLLLTLTYQATQKFQTGRLVLPTYPEPFRLARLFEAVLFEDTELFGLIVESDTKIVLSFRGTATFDDALRDLQARLVPFHLIPDGGNVHRGFLDVYTRIGGKNKVSARDLILTTLVEMDPRKQLYVTGSSLGAALATLATLDIAVNTPFKQPVIYTNGSPRVGDATFARRFNRTIRTSYRLANEYDIITQLAPEITGYVHVRQEIPLKIRTGNPAKNHYLTTAYIPAIIAKDPAYAALFCAQNPRGFCPSAAELRYYT